MQAASRHSHLEGVLDCDPARLAGVHTATGQGPDHFDIGRQGGRVDVFARLDGFKEVLAVLLKVIFAVAELQDRHAGGRCMGEGSNTVRSVAVAEGCGKSGCLKQDLG